MNKMKILQVLPTLSAGGAEGFVTNLGVSLSRLGAEVQFFLLAGVRAERGRVLHDRLRRENIKVYGIEERNIRTPHNLFRLAHIIRTWRPDIVQANLFSAEVVVAVASTLVPGCSGCYVRRLANTEHPHGFAGKIFGLLDGFYRQTIACSPSVSDSYRNLMGDNLKSELVTITNGGLLQSAVTSVEERWRARKKLAISDESFVVCHIGRMAGGGRSANNNLKFGQKAHDVLIKAFAKAFKNDPDSVLILVGDGPLREETEAMALSFGISKKVRFLGQLSEPWLALNAADMFCLPSRHEGLPNALIEAASCGLPVVASDIPEIRDLYQGSAWRLAAIDDVDQFANAMRSIRENRDEYLDFARGAAEDFLQKFSMENCALNYLNNYNSIEIKKLDSYETNN